MTRSTMPLKTVKTNLTGPSGVNLSAKDSTLKLSEEIVNPDIQMCIRDSCGECSRVCPQHIPLHLLNRKFIKDIDEFYGEYQGSAAYADVRVNAYDATCPQPYNLINKSKTEKT